MLPLLQSSLPRPAFYFPRPWRQERKSGERKIFFPLVKKDQVRDHLSKLDTHKSVDPDEMHPQVYGGRNLEVMEDRRGA